MLLRMSIVTEMVGFVIVLPVTCAIHLLIFVRETNAKEITRNGIPNNNNASAVMVSTAAGPVLLVWVRINSRYGEGLGFRV